MNFHGLTCGLGRIFRNESLMVPINSISRDVPVRISKKVDQQ